MSLQPASSRVTDVQALVTGAAGGIGRAISLGVAAGGGRGLPAGRDAERIRAIGAERAALGSGHRTMSGDFMNTSFLSELAHQTLAWSHGRLSLLVCSAGHYDPAPVERTP